MLGGHIKNYVRKTSQGIFGNNICTLVQDYSGYPDEHYPDNGYIRLMQFCPATNQINVKTYSPDVNTYLTSSEHQFTLNYNMSSYSPNLMNVTWQTNASGEWVTFNTSTNKTNGTYYAYNTTWVNEYNITYYWSVNCTDGTSWTNETYWFNTEDEPSSNPPPNNPGSSSPDEENEPPIANAGGPYNGTVNQTIVFNASKSDDPDGEILWYRWNFTNDSTWDTSWLTTSHINYTYNQSGNYTVVLQVKDISGSTDLDSTPALILLVSPSNETENTNQPTPPPSTNTSNETSGTNNNKQSPSQTPGFELLYCLCSVIFLLSINRKTPFLQNGDLH